MIGMDLNRKESAGEIGHVEKRVRLHRHSGVCFGQWRGGIRPLSLAFHTLYWPSQTSPASLLTQGFSPSHP